MTELALQLKISDIVDEYNKKVAGIKDAIKAFEDAGRALVSASTVCGVYSGERIDEGRASEHVIQSSLLKSAWRHIYNGLNIAMIASAKDKRLFEQTLEKPAPFTLENIRATFGQYILDPRANILRGLAEVFCDLDPAYKSHEKMKIGVSGLPKRIILTNVGGYGSWGRDRLQNVLNALAQYQNKPLVTYHEMEAILADEDALLETKTIVKKLRYTEEEVSVIARGVRLRRFSNGNGHLFFEPDTLKDINLALAEYYGEVLPDCSDEKPTKKQESTSVAKDLQYYPTPKKVVERIIDGLAAPYGLKVLEPSCGCGRFLDALRDKGANVFGIEIDQNRAEICKAKGHAVLVRNFLETVPTGDYDLVIMNPPFYGKHYAKHIGHAMKFLRSKGKLICVLPNSARYDHGLVDGRWDDLPVGSFTESGTNINTTI